MSLVGHPSPPVFSRGPSRHTRLMLLVLVCLMMLVADLRFRYLEVVRQGLTVVMHPVQLVASAPVDFVRNAAVYFATLVEVQMENAELRRNQLQAAQRLLRFEALERENAELRRVLGMAESLKVRSVAADILYDAPDPFARKVIIDRGAGSGVEAGMAVLDADGMIGQVTRVYPVQAEVTLLSDKNQSVPVQVERSALRGVLFGNGKGPLELRFILADADVRVGDRLVTSGLDGIFLPGLPIATVTSVSPDSDGFMDILAEPAGRVDRAIQVLVLGRDARPQARPDPADALPVAPEPLPTPEPTPQPTPVVTPKPAAKPAARKGG